jgi:hypothetical protein
MTLNSTTSNARVLDWSLAIGGFSCFVIGIAVLVESQQAPIPRSFVFLVSVFITSIGVSNLLNPGYPELSARFKFIGRVFAGFAIFSLSWAISHR